MMRRNEADENKNALYMHCLPADIAESPVNKERSVQTRLKDTGSKPTRKQASSHI